MDKHIFFIDAALYKDGECLLNLWYVDSDAGWQPKENELIPSEKLPDFGLPPEEQTNITEVRVAHVFDECNQEFLRRFYDFFYDAHQEELERLVGDAVSGACRLGIEWGKKLSSSQAEK